MPSRAVQSRTEPPTDLPAASRELWSQLVAEHPGLAPSAAAATAPNASELLVLRAVVDVVTRLEEVRQAIASEGMTVEGSQGQPRDNPLLGVEVKLRGELVERVSAWSRACSEARLRW